jgi:type IV secretory pathway VirJ component
MKRFIFVIGLIVSVLMVNAQDPTNPSLLRSSKAVAALNTVPYAWLYFADEAATITVSAEDTYYTITQGDTLWNNGATQRITLDNDSLFATVAGDYAWNLVTSYAMTADDTIHLAIKHNSTEYRVSTTVSVGAEVITAGGPGILPSVDVGDTIMVQVQNANDATNVSVLDGSLLFYLIRYD